MNRILAVAILLGITGCNTSYVWLGGEGGKNNSEEGSNPNNNVITIK